ncbi:YfaP family protein [Flavitalea antarctica]
MKKLIAIFSVIIVMISCRKERVDLELTIEPPDHETWLVNFYKNVGTTQESLSPITTIKNANFQVLGLGNFINSVPQKIGKLYFSDSATSTEWIVLVNDEGKPEFMYGIDSYTGQRLPHLYWADRVSNTKTMIRYYEYDWSNRLGTLKYEGEILDGIPKLTFGIRLPDSEIDLLGARQKRNKNQSRAFRAPVWRFERLGQGIARDVQTTILGSNGQTDETMDEAFNRSVFELMDLLKETKDKLIQAPCTVAETLNKADKGFICKLAEKLNQITDKEFFDDVKKATDQVDTQEPQEHQGSRYNFDFDFFDNIDLTDNISRHLNDIKNAFDANIKFEEWIIELRELLKTENNDLNDLTDSKGVIQIGLSWNQAVDIDLHVTDPAGETIFFDHPGSRSGGYLDLDDVDGYGPENVYWTENIPDGTYKISLVYYGPEDGPLTDCTVRVINGLGSEKTYKASLKYESEKNIPVTSFTKRGQQITFHN